MQIKTPNFIITHTLFLNPKFINKGFVIVMEAPLESKIKKSIIDKLNPVSLEIENLSHLHIGHTSLINNTSNETHFKLKIKSKMFNGRNKVSRQRMVYSVLNYAFDEGLHAIEMECLSDSE